jgi:hypothetical protein
VAVTIVGALQGAVFIGCLVYAGLMVKPVSWKFWTAVGAVLAGVLFDHDCTLQPNVFWC